MNKLHNTAAKTPDASTPYTPNTHLLGGPCKVALWVYSTQTRNLRQPYFQFHQNSPHLLYCVGSYLGLPMTCLTWKTLLFYLTTNAATQYNTAILELCQSCKHCQAAPHIMHAEHIRPSQATASCPLAALQPASLSYSYAKWELQLVYHYSLCVLA